MKAQLYAQNLQHFLSFKNQLRDPMSYGNTTAHLTVAEPELQHVSNVKPQSQSSAYPQFNNGGKLSPHHLCKLKRLSQFRPR